MLPLSDYSKYIFVITDKLPRFRLCTFKTWCKFSFTCWDKCVTTQNVIHLHIIKTVHKVMLMVCYISYILKWSNKNCKTQYCFFDGQNYINNHWTLYWAFHCYTVTLSCYTAVRVTLVSFPIRNRKASFISLYASSTCRFFLPVEILLVLPCCCFLS